MVAPEIPLDLRQRPVNPLLAMGNDHDVIAHLFRVFHDVSREQHRPPLPGNVDHDLPHRLAVHRIEPAERLIED